MKLDLGPASITTTKSGHAMKNIKISVVVLLQLAFRRFSGKEKPLNRFVAANCNYSLNWLEYSLPSIFWFRH